VGRAGGLRPRPPPPNPPNPQTPIPNPQSKIFNNIDIKSKIKIKLIRY